jgi:acyl-CoA reductase-like NAD-dependent aldehyde dehydrogenase
MVHTPGWQAPAEHPRGSRRIPALRHVALQELASAWAAQVEGSIAKGARLLCGGKPVDGNGAFYPPTVLSGVTEGMPAFDEETFGPVAALTRVPDIASAIHAANASQFGLSGNLWTRDLEFARRVARDLYTGGVFINGFSPSDPRVPVGGVNNSGYGRELSHFGACVCKRTNRLDRERLSIRRLDTSGGEKEHAETEPLFTHLLEGEQL